MRTIQKLVKVSLDLDHRRARTFCQSWSAVILDLSFCISANISSAHTLTLPCVCVQAVGSEAAYILAPGCLGNPSSLQHPTAGCPEGQDPGWAEEAEPELPPKAEPDQAAILPGREMLRQLQAALPTPVQLLNWTGQPSVEHSASEITPLLFHLAHLILHIHQGKALAVQ